MHPNGANCNGKIYFFMKENVYVVVKMNTEKHITLKLVLLEQNMHMIVTLVYAKFEVGERLLLWDCTYQLDSFISVPQLVLFLFLESLLENI